MLNVSRRTSSGCRDELRFPPPVGTAKLASAFPQLPGRLCLFCLLLRVMLMMTAALPEYPPAVRLFMILRVKLLRCCTCNRVLRSGSGGRQM